jgi:hypothetical protein
VKALRWTMMTAALCLGAACGSHCPDGQTLVAACLECGQSGTCVSTQNICATSCTAQSDCTLPQQCLQGLCQPQGCQ